MTISLDAYSAALEEIEIEKTAQRIVDDYGTSEGFMPEAYILAFDNWEHEKRAEYLVNTYGTMQGALPPAYAVAFDNLEKDAGLQALGHTISGGVRRAGNAIKASGTEAAAAGTGGTMRTAIGDKVIGLSKALEKSPGAQKALGGAALATPALAYMAG